MKPIPPVLPTFGTAPVLAYSRAGPVGRTVTTRGIKTHRNANATRAARSLGYVTGQQGNTGGVFMADDTLDVRTSLVCDDKPKAHKYHSGQFRSPIQKRWEYWNT